jgi:4-amino-4-deoxy-L-arabinose transferase-like glycosyltransferase
VRTQVVTALFGIVVGVVLAVTTKNTIVALVVGLFCLAIILAIEVFKRLHSLGAAGGLLAFLALTVALFMVVGGGGVYAIEESTTPGDQSSEKAFSLTMNPQIDLLKVEGEVSQFRASGSVSGLGQGETIWMPVCLRRRPLRAI